MPKYDPWKGFSAGELLGMSPTKLGNLESRPLRALVTRLASAANKRLRNLEKLPFTPPSLAAVRREGGKFTAKGKSDSQLLMEYQRLKKFMEGETATVKGAKQFKKEADEELARRFGFEEDYFSNMDEEESMSFWGVFDELRPLADSLGITATDFAAIVNDCVAEYENPVELREAIERRLYEAYETKKEQRRAARKQYRNARSNRW